MRHLTLALAFACLSLSAGAQDASPAGLWRTFDDQTGRETGLVRIDERNGTLTGTIEAATDPADAARRCDKCDGDRHNKPAIGLTIITDMHWDGKEWSGGEILEPQTGRLYHCTIRLIDAGRSLIVRGYFGLSLFGRSQTWQRTP